MPTLEEKPMLTPPPSPPPSPLMQNRTQLPQVGVFPRKSTTLPARVNPSDVYKMGSEEDDIMINGSLGMHNTSSSSIEHNSGRYRSHSTHKEPENLDCINELIEEGLVPEETERTNRYSNHYHHQPRQNNRRRHSETRRPHYVNVSIDMEPETHNTSYLHLYHQTNRHHRHSTNSQPTSTVSHHQQVPQYVDNEELRRDGNRIKTNKKRSSADQWWLRYENGYKTGDSSSVYPYRSMTMQQ